MVETLEGGWKRWQQLAAALNCFIANRTIYLPFVTNKQQLIVKAMVYSSSHVWMWELDHKEGLAPKNWCFWIMVLEKTLKSSLDSKEIKPVNPKWNQPWIFIGRTDAEALIFWSPEAKNRLIGKDPDAGKDWRQEEKGTTEARLLHGITNSMDMSWADAGR